MFEKLAKTSATFFWNPMLSLCIVKAPCLVVIEVLPNENRQKEAWIGPYLKKAGSLFDQHRKSYTLSRNFAAI